MAELKSLEKSEEPEKVGVAATFDEESAGDVALLSLAPRWWFKIYLVFSITLAVLEPFLVAFPDTTYYAQIAVLAASTILFLFGYIATMAVMPEGSLLHRFREAFLSEVWIEVVCLIIGWSLIFRDPGMAALRCFRVFRFVWYSEFYRAEKGSIFYPITFFSHIVLQYLEKLGHELFTTDSKGGIVVLGFFFYMAYIYGVAFWQRTQVLTLAAPEAASGNECDTLQHCFLIMLRLTFWDGSGFDFLLSLMDVDGNGGLVSLLFLYMCISAMVLLNGLIGIFGGAFASATDEVDKGEETLLALERVENLCKKLDADVTALKQNKGVM